MVCQDSKVHYLACSLWSGLLVVIRLLLIIIVIIYSFESFSHQCYLMVSHWSLSDNKSPQVSRTFLSMVAPLNNGIVWMVLIVLFFSKFSSSFIIPLRIVLRAPITISITVTFMFHSFFSCLPKFWYLSRFFLFLRFYSLVSWNNRIRYSVGSFLFFLFFSFFFFFWLPLGRSSGQD